jgi:rubredoxin
MPRTIPNYNRRSFQPPVATLQASRLTTAAQYKPDEPPKTEPALKKYMCLICGWIYEEAAGAPDEGIAPGTRWEDVPPNWTCPECGARKDDFEMIEI